MDDQFLHALRSDPSPEFARRLARRLREVEAPRVRNVSPRVFRLAAAVASAALVAFAFSFPAVRAGAQAFLDWFRVVNFAGVAFDEQRVGTLLQSGLDWPHLIAEQVEVVHQPGPIVSFATPAEAAPAAGVDVRTPAWLPYGFVLTSTSVADEVELRAIASEAKIKTVLETLGLDDVTVPVGIDGEQITLHTRPVVRLVYGDGTRSATLLESKSPEVSFPAGLDLSQLAEIGLRILGMGRSEAYQLAQSIDWRSTLLVPVPANAASFHHVDVQGQPALAIQTAATNTDRSPSGGDSLLLWSYQGQVYALHGSIRAEELLEMAQTLQ